MDVVLFGKHEGDHGPTRVTRGLARALASLGHSVTVLAYGNREGSPGTDVELDLISSMPETVSGWRELYRTVNDRLADLDRDLFHALERYPFRADVRTVQWTSDMVVVWQRTGKRPPIRTLAGEVLLNWGSRKGAKASDVVVAQSPETQRQMKRFWRMEPDAVIPLGIDSDFLREPTTVRTPPRVLVVGRIGPRKGQGQFLRHLDPDEIEFELRIVGEVEDSEYAKEAMEGWWDRALGYLSNEELEREYEEADLVVVPSHLETYSMVAHEAIAKGCAVVITSGCGFAQFDWSVERNGVFVARDGRGEASIVKRLVSDPGRLSDAKRAAFELGKELTWDEIASRYEVLYREVLE